MQRSGRTMQRSNTDLHKLYTGERRIQTEAYPWMCVWNVDDLRQRGDAGEKRSVVALKI